MPQILTLSITACVNYSQLACKECTQNCTWLALKSSGMSSGQKLGQKSRFTTCKLYSATDKGDHVNPSAINRVTSLSNYIVDAAKPMEILRPGVD